MTPAEEILVRLIRTSPEVQDAIKELVTEHTHATGISVDLETRVPSQVSSVEWA